MDGELIRSGPLSYQVTVSIGSNQDMVTITQDSIDVIRQQYIDTGKNERPVRSQFINSVPAGSSFSFAQIKSPDADWAIFTVFDDLELLQTLYGSPLTIESGYRTPARNGDITLSGRNSAHIYGNAVDINTFGNDSLWDQLHDLAVNAGRGCVEPKTCSAGVQFCSGTGHIHIEWGGSCQNVGE